MARRRALRSSIGVGLLCIFLALSGCVTTGKVHSPRGSAVPGLIASKTDRPPFIDGQRTDPQWEKARPVTTLNHISVRALYTDEEIFFLVRFPDAQESRLHTPWVWHKELGMYISGPQREDLLVLVWNMEDHAVDLNMYSDDNYRADVWYWRAAGTDLSGYADDGMCIVSSDEVKPQTRDINISRIECSRGKGKSGKKRYFLWTADAGDAPYTQKRHPREYQGEDIDVFGPSVPSGSRADIKAKGVWKDGYWTVELSRRLQTGYPDDVQFDIHRTYQFRICCQGGKRGTLEAYTAAALFGCEDVAGGIFLQFEPR